MTTAILRLYTYTNGITPTKQTAVPARLYNKEIFSITINLCANTFESTATYPYKNKHCQPDIKNATKNYNCPTRQTSGFPV